MMNERMYLLAFLAVYFVIVFVVPSIRVKRRTGINPYVFRNTDSAHDFLGRISKPITLLIFLVAFVNLVFPSAYQYFAPFLWLEAMGIKVTGFVLIHLALLWIVIAQIQMSNSWRVGIDDERKTELVVKGLFSVSRNPVFLGMIVTLIGIFCVLPNALTLVSAVTSTALFQVQVRLEEEHLARTHGDLYVEYCRRVKRWIL